MSGLPMVPDEVTGAMRRGLDRVGLLTPLRRGKWKLRVARRRSQQRARHSYDPGINQPRVFANAMAKSGSHILAQYLEGLEQLVPLVFTDQHPVRTITREGVRRDPEEVMRDLGRLEPGDMAWGYIPARPLFLDWFRRPDLVSYFVYRDPRDRIVSHVFYARDIHDGHAMRDFFHRLDTMEACIEATIRGVPGLIQDIRTSYESYLGWFEVESMLKVRFEDLVDERERALQRLLDHLEGAGVQFKQPRTHVIEVLNEAMAPRHSPTFRSGISGGWREHFSEKNVTTFKRVAGDLLQVLGYEDGDGWGL